MNAHNFEEMAIQLAGPDYSFTSNALIVGAPSLGHPHSHFFFILLCWGHILCVIQNSNDIDLTDMIYRTIIFYIVALSSYNFPYPSLVFKWGSTLFHKIHFNYLSMSILSCTTLSNSRYSQSSSATPSFPSMNAAQSIHYESTPISFTPSTSISLDEESKTFLSSIVSNLQTLNKNVLDVH